MSDRSRRQVCTGALRLTATLAVRGTALAATPPAPAPRPLARIIVDNDFAGDPDGLLALAYQLLSPTSRTVLVTTSALDENLAKLAGSVPLGRTAAFGADLARETLRRCGLGASRPVIAGAESVGAGPGQVSAAARAIVAEARRADDLPLYLTCGGPLTNVAAALRLDPAIARRMTVVWIGGGAYPNGGEEYNLSTDLAAARQVIETSDVPFWQAPIDVYAGVRMSQAEMFADLRPISPLTRWLHDKLSDLPSFVKPMGLRGVGDIALAPLTAVSEAVGRYETQPARRIGEDARYGAPIPARQVRRYLDLDTALIQRDMLAVFRLAAARRAA